MKDAFSYQYNIGYFDIDDKSSLKPSRLAGILQDLAVQHSDKVGYDLDWFSREQRAWILLNWHIVIDRFPREGEIITSYTWARPYRRVQADRSFLMEDAKGGSLCKAESRWVLLDTARRRPVKAPEEMFEAYHSDRPPTFENNNFRMPENFADCPQTERCFPVTRRDTDTNNHVNNTVYLEWALDDISDEVYYSSSIKDIRVEYKKECPKGTVIKSFCYLNDLGNGTREMTSVFTNAEDEKTVYCQVTTVWTSI